MALKKAVVRRKKSPAENAAITPIPGAPSREAIERRAYEIFQRRGGRGGDPTGDWLQAERELIEQN